MSMLSQLKTKVGYQERVPRCSTCKHMSQQHLLRDSLPTRFLQLCSLHHFTIKRHACCDTWESKDGDVLA